MSPSIIRTLTFILRSLSELLQDLKEQKIQKKRKRSN